MSELDQVRREISAEMDAVALTVRLDRREFDAGRYDGLKQALEAIDRGISRATSGKREKGPI